MSYKTLAIYCKLKWVYEKMEHCLEWTVSSRDGKNYLVERLATWLCATPFKGNNYRKPSETERREIIIGILLSHTRLFPEKTRLNMYFELCWLLDHLAATQRQDFSSSLMSRTPNKDSLGIIHKIKKLSNTWSV